MGTKSEVPEKDRVIVLVLRYCRISAQSIELLPKASREYLEALVFLRFDTVSSDQSYPSPSTIAAARLRIASAPSTQ